MIFESKFNLGDKVYFARGFESKNETVEISSWVYSTASIDTFIKAGIITAIIFKPSVWYEIDRKDGGWAERIKEPFIFESEKECIEFILPYFKDIQAKAKEKEEKEKQREIEYVKCQAKRLGLIVVEE